MQNYDKPEKKKRERRPRLPSDVLITMPELEVLTQFRKPTIYEKIRMGEFPKQIRLGPNKVAWLRSEVLDWIAARAAERDAA